MAENKRKTFINEYLKCFNAAEAARRAGYSVRSARQQGDRLMSNDGILAEITKRMDEAHMSANEALRLLADQARGDMAQLMDISSVGFNLDMKRAQELGLTKLIKRVKQKTTTYQSKRESEEDREITELEIELYDAQSAIDKILRVHGKYKDTIDLTTGGEKIIVTLVKEDDATSRDT